MNKHESIINACHVVEAHGYEIPETIKVEVSELDNPHYRVAVVGKFQVGKSTLINKAFLADRHLLAEGRGLCTTALATDIEYGDTSSLEVYTWKDGTHAEEVLDRQLSNPSPEDVIAATASSSMDTRVSLAQQVSRVKITEPNEALKGYTIIDTPGLDDPNRELLVNTTFRIIPKSDVALLVIECRALDTVEKDLLRNSLIGQGISQLMVLISYKPQLDMDQQGRKAIRENIQAELASIGHEDIPVEVYCFDPTLEDILCDVSEIRLAIGSYLEQHALAGREERVAHVVRQMLHDYLLKIATEIKLIASSEAEKASFHDKVDEQERKCTYESHRVCLELKEELGEIEEETVRFAKLLVDEVFIDFCASLEDAADVSSLKRLVENAPKTLRIKLTEKMPEVGLKLRKSVMELLERYTVDMEKSFRMREIFIKEELGVPMPLMAKIPSIVYTIIDVGLLDVALPGGLMIAGIVKLLLRKINIVDLVVKPLIVSQVKKSLDKSHNQVDQQLKQQIHDSLQQTFEKLMHVLESSNRQQFDAIRQGVAAVHEESPDLAMLTSAKKDIEQALETLGAE